MAELETILAALNLIDTKKEDLRKSYDQLQAVSSSYSSFSPFSFTWSDLDSYLSSIQNALTRRFHELKRLQTQHSHAVPDQPPPPQASLHHSRTSISKTLKRKEPLPSSDSPAQDANLLTHNANGQPSSKSLPEQFGKKGPSSSVSSLSQLAVGTPIPTPNMQETSSSLNSLTQLGKEAPMLTAHLNEPSSPLKSPTQMVKEAPLSMQTLNGPSKASNSVSLIVKMKPLSTKSASPGITSSSASLNKALEGLVHEARLLMQAYEARLSKQLHEPPSSSNTLSQTTNLVHQNFGARPLCSQNRIESITDEIAKQVLLWPELKDLCENMDIYGLRNFICCKMSTVDLAKFRVELLGALRCAPDPALLVFSGMNWFFSNKSSQRRAYKFLLEQLRALCPKKNSAVEKLAGNYVALWKDHLLKHGANAGEAYRMLFLVACYSLQSSLTNDELLKFAFLAAEDHKAPKLCIDLGLKKQIPDLIQKLVSEGKYIAAVKFIIKSDLSEEVPPVPILKAYVEELKQHTDKAVEERRDPISSEVDAETREINELKSVIATIHNYKLDSEYPCLNLYERIRQLTKWKIDRSQGQLVEPQPKRQKNNMQHPPLSESESTCPQTTSPIVPIAPDVDSMQQQLVGNTCPQITSPIVPIAPDVDSMQQQLVGNTCPQTTEIVGATQQQQQSEKSCSQITTPVVPETLHTSFLQLPQSGAKSPHATSLVVPAAPDTNFVPHPQSGTISPQTTGPNIAIEQMHGGRKGRSKALTSEMARMRGTGGHGKGFLGRGGARPSFNPSGVGRSSPVVRGNGRPSPGSTSSGTLPSLNFFTSVPVADALARNLDDLFSDAQRDVGGPSNQATHPTTCPGVEASDDEPEFQMYSRRERLRIAFSSDGWVTPGRTASSVVNMMFKLKLNRFYKDWSDVPKKDQFMMFSYWLSRLEYDTATMDMEELQRRFYIRAGKCYRSIMSKIRRFGKPPWMNDVVYQQHLMWWSTPEFLASSARNTRNRNLGTRGPVHTAGSRTIGDTESMMKKQLRRDLAADEIYRATHMRRDGTWVDEHSRSLYDTFQDYVVTSTQELANTGDGTPPTIDRDRLWFTHVGGRKRGLVHGMGRSIRFATMSTGSSSSAAEMQALRDRVSQQDEIIQELKRQQEMFQRQQEFMSRLMGQSAPDIRPDDDDGGAHPDGGGAHLDGGGSTDGRV